MANLFNVGNTVKYKTFVAQIIYIDRKTKLVHLSNGLIAGYGEVTHD